MTSSSFEKFEEKLEREDYIQSIIREYYARKNAEVEKNMKLEVINGKTLKKSRKKINFKATGFHETNRERKREEEKKQKEINFKATGIHETNLERQQREASSRENKLIKREQQVENLLRKKKEFFVFFVRQKQTKMDFVIVKFLSTIKN